MLEPGAQKKITTLDPKSDLITGRCNGSLNRTNKAWRHTFIGINDKHPSVLERDVLETPISVSRLITAKRQFALTIGALGDCRAKLLCYGYCVIRASRVKHMNIIRPGHTLQAPRQILLFVFGEDENRNSHFIFYIYRVKNKSTSLMNKEQIFELGELQQIYERFDTVKHWSKMNLSACSHKLSQPSSQ